MCHVLQSLSMSNKCFELQLGSYCFVLSCIRSYITSSNGNIFRATVPLWGESTGHRWIPLTKASDKELWSFLWSAPEQTAVQTIETPVIWDAIAPIMTSYIYEEHCTRCSRCYSISCPDRLRMTFLNAFPWIGILGYWLKNPTFFQIVLLPTGLYWLRSVSHCKDIAIVIFYVQQNSFAFFVLQYIHINHRCHHWWRSRLNTREFNSLDERDFTRFETKMSLGRMSYITKEPMIIKRHFRYWITPTYNYTRCWPELSGETQFHSRKWR